MSAKSTFSNSTSQSYAVALYELAKENSELNNTEDGMNGLKKLLNDNSDFKEMILNPTVTKEEKNKVIIEMANQYNFYQTLKKFLSFLTSKNRLFFLNQIIDSFLDLVSSGKGELKAKLLSSKELSDSMVDLLADELSKDFQLNIDPNTRSELKMSVSGVEEYKHLLSVEKIIESNALVDSYSINSISNHTVTYLLSIRGQVSDLEKLMNVNPLLLGKSIEKGEADLEYSFKVGK